MNYYAIGRASGVLIGAVVGLLICFFAFKVLNKNGKTKTEYDERQKEIRGVAYMWAFWTMSGYLAALILLEEAELAIPVTATVKYFFGFFLAGLVLSMYCIWNGAYFGLNNVTKRWYVFITLFGIINIAIAIKGIVSGSMMENGVVNYPCINLLCGILLLAIISALLIKRKIDSIQESETE